MGNKPSKDLMDFMAKHKIDADEVWEVRVGGAWAIKHKALERAGANAGVVFDRPALVESNAADKIAAIVVFGKIGDRVEWSIGEASPANNKNAYCYAMAEKRGKDRVILKLLNAHGTLYSEEEADDFAPKRVNPHVTRPEDILPPTEYDEHGEVIDNIPHGDPAIERMPKAKAREDFAKCQAELRATATIAQLEKWGAANKDRVATFPHDWAEMIRGIYTEHRNDLRASPKAAQ